MQLDFLNSNWHRQYPFRDLYGVVDLTGMVVPSDILVSLRLTVAPAYADVYVDKIFTNDGYVSVSFASAQGALGYAADWVEQDNQAITVRDYNGGILGCVTIGNRSSTVARQTFTFDTSNGLLEPTCFLIVEPPWVSSLQIKRKTLRGELTIVSNTLSVTTNENTLQWNVKAPEKVQSRKDRLAKNLTCTQPVVSALNEVKPDQAGNIDIYAVEPLRISATTIHGVTHLQITTPGLTKEDLCKLVNLPVDDPTTTYPALNTVTAPEWAGWPQYN